METMEFLVQHGAEIELKDNDGRIPLSWAAGKGNTGPMRFLLETGADIRTKDFNGATAPSWPAMRSKDNVETVGFLVEQNVEIDPKENTNGQSPFSFAAEQGHCGVMDVLLNHGADINSKSNDGRTPLSFAIEYGDISEHSPKFLVGNGADIEPKDKVGGTPLWWAIGGLRNEPFVVKYLLEFGADVETRTAGMTPLIWAVVQGNYDATQSLLKGGAYINAKDEIKRMTALMHSVLYSKRSSASRVQEENFDDRVSLFIIEILLDQKDIDINYKSASGWTVLSLAISHRHPKAAEILRAHGATESAGLPVRHSRN